MHAESETPKAHQDSQKYFANRVAVRRGHNKPYAEKPGTEGPSDIDDAGVAAPVLHKPQQRHNQRHPGPAQYKGLRRAQHRFVLLTTPTELVPSPAPSQRARTQTSAGSATSHASETMPSPSSVLSWSVTAPRLAPPQ